jgi:hypothetical protein
MDLAARRAKFALAAEDVFAVARHNVLLVRMRVRVSEGSHCAHSIRLKRSAQIHGFASHPNPRFSLMESQSVLKPNQ